MLYPNVEAFTVFKRIAQKTPRISRLKSVSDGVSCSSNIKFSRNESFCIYTWLQSPVDQWRISLEASSNLKRSLLQTDQSIRDRFPNHSSLQRTMKSHFQCKYFPIPTPSRLVGEHLHYQQYGYLHIQYYPQ